MQSIIELNNTACDLIENDRFDEALEFLTKALNAVQRDLAEEDAEDKEDLNSETDADSLPGISSSIESREVNMQRRLAKLGKLDGFVYWHPMQAVNLPPATGTGSLSLIIVFNLALCHHLMALQSECEKSVSRLQAALQLYELGLSMHMEGNIIVDMTHALAMVNNCGQIYMTMNKPRKAKRFMAHMLSSLMIMIECGEAEDLDEFDGFIQNASNLILRTNVAAAA